MEDKVIRLREETNPYGGGEILSSAGLLNNISQRHPELAPEWFTKGISVETLAPGGQWQQSRMRIALTFTPEQASASAPQPPQPTVATK